MNTELVKIPNYTADDFYSSSDPYSFLYQFKDDKFLLGQMREKMKAKASEVGVKGFVGLWNAYLESVHSQRGVSLDNATNFEGQPLELFSGQYLCDDLGVITADKYGYELMVCRHPIMPIKRFVNIDSGEEKLEIAYKKGKNWRTLIADKATIASSNGILQLAANGVLVNSENAKYLSSYLLDIEQLNYEDIPEQRSAGRLGWVGDYGFSPYVDDLAFDGQANFKHIFAAVRSSGEYQKWIEIMKKMRKEKSCGRFFLAASFASVIIEPCGLLPFFLHAWGGTETGKTVGLMIAASVWASPKMGEYITTFNSTLVGQEMTAAFLNSLPMCIDELQIQSSAGIKDFDKIIYQLTEGVGRTRGSKVGGLQKTNIWKNCIITNGEHPISNSNSGGGAINRLIEFECDEKIYSDLVEMCSVIQHNYGFAGKEFIECLQNDGMKETIKSIQRKYYNELLKSDSTEKQVASASAILAADFLATELIFKDDNNLTITDITNIMTKKDEVNVNKRAYDFIFELVVRNPNKFDKNDYGEYQGEVWGKIEKNCVYIIKSVFDREMQNAGFNSTAFLSWAKRRELLICEPSRRTKITRINGNVTNCVCIVNNDFSQNPSYPW